jgi:glycosyltransferase involved in cell wall biosynthesis
MRVLVVHNFYRSENASGENLSVRDEIEGLRARGCDVEVLSSDSDVINDGHISLPELAIRPIWSRRSVERTRESIRRFRPHVALVENLFPLHSPAVIRVLHDAGVPVAAGVRSYRMWCVQSNMFRDGKECRECIGSAFNAPAIRHGCYQGRAASSAPMALGLAMHRGTWQLVDRFLAVSDFVKQELIGVGIAADRITIRDNFVSDRGRVDTPGEGFVFAGRLGAEKGVEMLLDAWQRSEVWRTSRLVVAGSGPLDALVQGVDPSFHVHAAGLVPHQRALELVRDAAVVVVPSLWHEPFGRGVAEAASMSRPALVSDRGGLPELVTDGLTGWVSRADPESFAAALRAAADPAEQVRRGREARVRYEQRFTAERSLDVLHRTLDELASR